MVSKSEKRILACFLALAMIVTTAGTSGFVSMAGYDKEEGSYKEIASTTKEEAEVIIEEQRKENTITEGDYEYTELGDGTVQILSYTGEETDVTIPAKLGKKNVSSIGYKAFSGNTNIRSVKIPKTVTGTQYFAFDNCEYLHTVTFEEGSNLQMLGGYSFNGCSNLKNITLPNTLKELGPFSFSDCYSLESIKFGSNLKVIGKYSFAGTALKKVDIVDNITYLGEGAFIGCTNLSEVTLGKGLKGIEYATFSETESLTNIVIPSNITYIEEDAFYYSGLTSIAIPDSVSRIGMWAFCMCEDLNTVIIGNGLTDISWAAFAGCDVKTLSMGNNVKTIGEYAFADSINLKEVTIPNTVTAIAYGAFSNCEKLETIVFSKNLEKIGGQAFDDTSWLNSQPDGSVYIENVYYLYKGEMPANATLEIKAGTKGIAGFALAEQTNLTYVNIPEGVTNIGELAFYNCPIMKTATIPTTVTEVGEYSLGYKAFVSDNAEDYEDKYVETDIWWGDVEKIEDYVIYGVIGSDADRYAQEHGFEFIGTSVDLDTPELVEIYPDYDSITIMWEPVTSATGYQIWRTADRGATWEYIDSTANCDYDDTRVSGGKHYIYSIYAYLVLEDGSAIFSDASTEYLGASLYLETPYLCDVYMKNGAVNVEWEKVEGAMGYQVWRTDDRGATWKYVGTSGTTSYTDKTASADNYCIYSIYAYRVLADKSQVWSKASTEYLGCTPLDKPVMKDVFTNGTTAFVTWNPVKNASGYQVWRTADNGVTWDYIGTSGSTMYADKTLQMGKNYKYSIYAYHYTPKGTATWSLASTEYLGCTPMATPVLKNVSASGNNVLVEWNKLDGADGYQIWRTNNHGATWEYIGTSGTTSFIDKTTAAGGYYQYSIYAYKYTAGGNASWSLASTQYLGIQR